MTIQPKTKIGRYQILELIGRGGMAEVYKARHVDLDVDVAIKFIRTDRFPPDILRSVVKRFRNEAKKMAQLSHSNIVKVTDYGRYEGIPFLVMEYLPGGTLKKYMGKPMPYQQAARLLLPVADALAYAHSKGVIHRDVKPGNILLSETGQLMLSDFGVAKMMNSEQAQGLTATGAAIGTPEYMAPEQAVGKKIDRRVDIYSLGVIFYELVTGRRPFTADTPMEVVIKQSTEPLPPPSNFVKGLPQDVEQILFKALDKDPGGRFANMGAFAQALKGLATDARPTGVPRMKPASQPKATRKDTPPMERSSAGRRFPLGWLLVGLGVTAGIIALMAGLRPGEIDIPASADEAASSPPQSEALPDSMQTDGVAAGDGGFSVAYLTDLGGLAGSDEVKGFSDLGWDACLKAEEELGIEAIVLEANELADLEPNLVKMAEEGHDLLVCGGYLFSDAVMAVAPNYPDTKFAVIDGYAEGDNVQNIGFASNEGSFLVGALAAGMTETGTIAFIGGMECPLIEAFEAGYIAGAFAIDPDIEVLSGYTGSFTDVAVGKELALVQNAQGADVIYPAAGQCALGTIEAAEENDFYAIGVDVDQDHLAPNNMLTSMLKHVQVGTFNTIKEAFEGNFQPGFKTYTLADGTIGYSKSAEMAEIIPADLYAAVDALADRINAGEFVVPMTIAEAIVFTLD